MASVCELCGKKPQFGMRISHSHRRTKRRWNPNIQRVRALVNGAPRRLNVCTGCIKAGKIKRTCCISLTVILIGSAMTHGSPDKGKLTITFFSIGQGDSMLVTFPDGSRPSD